MNRIRKLVNSFGYALRGIAVALRTEQNLQIHLIAVVVVTIAGIMLDVSATEWMVLVICFGMLISAELFNTAIEKLVDEVSPEHNSRAGLVKDVAAGGVLVLAIAAIIIGGIIFIPKLI